MLPSDGITAGIFGEFLEAKIFPAMSPEVTRRVVFMYVSRQLLPL